MPKVSVCLLNNVTKDNNLKDEIFTMLFFLHISCQMGRYSFVLEGWGVGGLGLKRGTVRLACLA